MFTVATADNFEMLQSHTAMYCGDQLCTYHETTIQITQPDPKLVLPVAVLLATLEEGHHESPSMGEVQADPHGQLLPPM